MSNLITIPPVIRYPFSKRAMLTERPYHVTDPGWPDLHEFTGGGQGVKVGHVDTGVDLDHVEITDQIVDAKDFTGSRSGAVDRDGHGTHTASTIAGRNVGVAPNVSLYIAKGLGDDGSGSDQSVAQAIRWLVSQDVHIISMSLGSPYKSKAIYSACLLAAEAGILIFAASGNEGADASGYPAAYDDCCLSIGAVDRKLQLARFSNRGVSVDLVDYGVEVYAAVPNAYMAMSGTSMATPCAAGLAANRLSAELKHLGEIKTKSIADLKLFEGLSIDLGETGRDDSYGWGFPDAAKIVKAGLDLAQPLPEPAPPATGESYISGVVNGVAGKFVFQPNH